MTVRATDARICLSCICLTTTLLIAPAPARASAPSADLIRTMSAADSKDGRRPVVLPRHPARGALPSVDPGPIRRTRPGWVWLLLGRLHPMVVHFPIALLTAAAIIEAWRAARRQPLPSEAGTYCLAFGVIGAVAAVCLGTVNAGHQSMTGQAATALERHQVMGWISTMAAMAALGAGRVARRAGGFRTMAVYVGLLLATGAAVGATGHLGGGLVYGDDYLTGVLPWNQRVAMGAARAAIPPDHDAVATAVPAATQAEAVDFTRDVMPIIKRNCVECHGPDKVKARLRMDSVEGLQKGGKNGALLKPGDPENSLIIRRVLGLDGEDQMPLDKDPLSEKQIDTLRRWIAAGGAYPPAGSQ